MSHNELRAEYEKLKMQVAQWQDRLASGEAENAALRQLLERLQKLTHAYDQKLAEAQAQVAEPQCELFGPKAESELDKMHREVR